MNEEENRKVSNPHHVHVKQKHGGETIRRRLAAARAAICSEVVLAVLGADDPFEVVHMMYRSAPSDASGLTSAVRGRGWVWGYLMSSL